eukprot:764898-Hanusia_phi.AAC.2
MVEACTSWPISLCRRRAMAAFAAAPAMQSQQVNPVKVFKRQPSSIATVWAFCTGGIVRDVVGGMRKKEKRRAEATNFSRADPQTLRHARIAAQCCSHEMLCLKVAQ